MNYDLCLHIDSNDPAMLRLVLKNAANYIKGLPGEKFQLAVVANGPAVILFTDEHADLRELAAPPLAGLLGGARRSGGSGAPATRRFCVHQTLKRYVAQQTKPPFPARGTGAFP